ncbi:hypothetical protein [uncultured Sphingomonas sp.]|uniref:hypothetical protein n=1 Tax=uncultured Sphingomonas sp. TaxID=158754 RepID=UPI00261EFF3C|nr:hypothetical protein [uncultured Sphingomonas sp.]
MIRKLSLLAAAAGGVLALVPASASAQSWGVYYSYGRPYYDQWYPRQYYYNYDHPYYRDYDNYYRREYWRDRRERWERERTRRYWMHERWEREHRWHRDDDDDDDN